MRIVPCGLIVILSWTLIANLPSFGEEIGEQPGEVVSEHLSQGRDEGSQGGQAGDQGSDPSTQSTAPTTDGLQMSIEVTETNDANLAQIRVSFQAEEGAVLNLGEMRANGRVLIPQAITLTLTDSRGASRQLHVPDWDYPAGRIDDYILPLAAGAVHTLQLSLLDYKDPGMPEFQPGTWTIRAEFTGTGAVHLNSDTQGLSSMHFWMGRLESPVVQFQIGGGEAETAASR